MLFVLTFWWSHPVLFMPFITLMTPTFLFLDQTSLLTSEYLKLVDICLLDLITWRLLWVELSLQKDRLNSLPLIPQDVTLHKSSIFVEAVKLKWGLEGGLLSNMTGVLINRGNVKHREKTMWRHTRRRQPCDWNGAATSQGTSRIAGRKPEEAMKDLLPEPSQRGRQHLDFRLLASRTVRQWACAVLSHPVCRTLDRSL